MVTEIATVFLIVSALLNVATVALVVATRRYANRAESALRAIDRDRHYLTREMIYQHPRTLR